MINVAAVRQALWQHVRKHREKRAYNPASNTSGGERCSRKISGEIVVGVAGDWRRFATYERSF